ncbi:potassium voltage-gated channel subfamily C member 1-like [Hemicordylus capensis]|uniref:potassium voltage-gated channel subfamily C member 1-like n=1 Tax=Hemicordylus capensis TaxID=884348 RepID=UPI002303174A|nr:potassium voltage-gated channel subfamily C member 1-like [Hemicordylus capensis]XP_053129650.1 potassium voltage-gated channel subfamily C member 1-like [Hemicordylus capensis]
MEPPQEKITLNVGGIRYRTYLSTLRAFPETKLGRLTEPQASTEFDYNPSTREFFFDRSPKLFGEVLNYYRTKHLHCPADVCQSVFQEELAFWGIGAMQLAPCCWSLNAREDQPEGYSIPDVHEGGDSQGFFSQLEGRCPHWWMRWQPNIWALFEKPYSSVGAMCVTVTSLLFCVGLLLLLCVESKAYVKVSMANDNHSIDAGVHTHNTYSLTSSYQQTPYFLHLELFCILWFMFEFSVRFLFCPDKKKFLKNPLNVADFVSLFPVFIELFSSRHIHGVPTLICWLGFLRTCYILKLLKTFKLIETPLMLRVLPYTLKSMLREIFLLLLVFAVEVLVFGAACYFAEQSDGSPDIYMFDILSSFWWAVITLTTVGYGDHYPMTPFSKVIGACTAVCGVLTIIIPVPIFFIRFKGYYRAAAMKEKRKEREKATRSS